THRPAGARPPPPRGGGTSTRSRPVVRWSCRRASGARVERAGTGAWTVGRGRGLERIDRRNLEGLEGVDRAGLARDLFGSTPLRVRPELPRATIVRQHRVHDLADPFARLAVVDGHDGFHAPIEVALHEVAGADVPLLVAPVREPEDPRVLQELANHAPHPDPLRL